MRGAVQTSLAALALCLAAGASQALSPEACDRTIYVSHGGETAHRDLGAGRVSFIEWWSQEGVYTDFVVMDCASGVFLRTRAHEERVRDRHFDRTDAVARIIEREVAASPALFSFDRLGRALEGTGRDIERSVSMTETCACAAFYPERRGDKTAFALG
ncbi:MAG: hypothetical protein KJO78_08310, partial [Alphaproteobacteria bacterium]|nr:hypothetical protein [Alphaproteobacteria bacterium]